MLDKFALVHLCREVVLENWTVGKGLSQSFEGIRKWPSASTIRISDALRGVKAVQELAAKHQLDPNQVRSWNQTVIEGMADVFSGFKLSQSTEAKNQELHANIGSCQLRVISIGSFEALSSWYNNVMIKRYIKFKKSKMITS